MAFGGECEVFKFEARAHNAPGATTGWKPESRDRHGDRTGPGAYDQVVTLLKCGDSVTEYCNVTGQSRERRHVPQVGAVTGPGMELVKIRVGRVGKGGAHFPGMGGPVLVTGQSFGCRGGPGGEGLEIFTTTWRGGGTHTHSFCAEKLASLELLPLALWEWRKARDSDDDHDDCMRVDTYYSG